MCPQEKVRLKRTLIVLRLKLSDFPLIKRLKDIIDNFYVSFNLVKISFSMECQEQCRKCKIDKHVKIKECYKTFKTIGSL